MAARGRAPKRLPLTLLLVAACALVTVCSASSSASASASGSSSTAVGDCDMGEWLSNPLVKQCGVDSSYNFSSGVQPTLAQSRAMCVSTSCTTLLQAASLSTGIHECTLPFGDHILLLEDLVEYVLGICSSASSGSSNSSSGGGGDGATSATASPSAATDSSASSDGTSSTPIVIAVAVGVVVLLALVALALWWRRQRRGRKRESTAGSSGHGSQPAYAPMLSSAARGGLLGSEHGNATGESGTTQATGESGAITAAPSSQSSSKSHARLADLAPWRMDVDAIQDLERLGHGAHGVVWRVLYRGSTVLASKRIQADQVSTQLTQRFIDEIFLLSHLQHPNIVAFVGVAWTMESDVQVLLEFMDAGDLRGFLTRPETPREWTLQKLSIAHDVAQALVYVHSFQPPLLHRDLKSQNVLLTAQGQDAIVVDTPLIAKLTDFGVSRFHSENNTMTVGVGTSWWLAPEVILGKPTYGPEADMFSFGVVLSELDSHALPYDDVRGGGGGGGAALANVAILQRVATGELRPTFHVESCPPALVALARRCLEHDPLKRVTAAQAASELRRIMEALAAQTAARTEP